MSYLPRMFKSVQTGTISLSAGVASATATINAVNVSNAIILPLGFTATVVNDTQLIRFELTNSTTVTCYHSTAVTGNNPVCAFVVWEFFPLFVQSIQSGVIIIPNGTTSNTATLNPNITVSNSIPILLGVESDVGGAGPLDWGVYLSITASQITAARSGNGGGDVHVGWMVFAQH